MRRSWFPNSASIVGGAAVVQVTLRDDSCCFKPALPASVVYADTGQGFAKQWDGGPEFCGRAGIPMADGSLLCRANTTRVTNTTQTFATQRFWLDKSASSRLRVSPSPFVQNFELPPSSALTIFRSESTVNMLEVKIGAGPGGATLLLRVESLCQVASCVNGQPGSRNSLYASSDGGAHWRYRSDIPKPPTVGGLSCEYPRVVETQLQQLQMDQTDGVGFGLIFISRCHPTPAAKWYEGSSFVKTLSHDSGLSWSAALKDEQLFAVAPAMQRLSDGRLLLVSGRPGIFFWVSEDATGSGSWNPTSLMKAHNRGMRDPSLRYSRTLEQIEAGADHESKYFGSSACHGDHGRWCTPQGNQSTFFCTAWCETTSYTSLLAHGNDSFTLFYDRLASGWAGPPGVFGSEDHVFAISFRVKSDDISKGQPEIAPTDTIAGSSGGGTAGTTGSLLPVVPVPRHTAPATPPGWQWAVRAQPGWSGPANTTLNNTAAVTRWAADVSPDSSRPEHPRPQLMRADRQWLTLNGIWGFSMNETKCKNVPGDLGCSTLPSPPFNRTLPGGILVPFPPQAALSGVRETPSNWVGWYRRELTLSELPRQVGDRVLVHVERCDFNCSVYFDGKLAGWHAGGYEPFALDVTSLVGSGSTHELLVGFDDRPVSQPEGKQSRTAFDHPDGIFYTCTSGIWDSVWLEIVPAVYIRDVRLEPSLTRRTLTIDVELCASDGQRGGVGLLNCSAPPTLMPPRVIGAKLLWQGEVVAQGTGLETTALVLEISSGHLLRPWSPRDPAMYEVAVDLVGDNTSASDAIVATVAFRELSIGSNGTVFARALLNSEMMFVTGVLQQGFWPDGIYTAATDAALEHDLLVVKQLGFNAVRMHMKVESRRFYHHADRLGIMILQDMPRCSMITGWSETWFAEELGAIVRLLRNHPSVVQYQLFNEGGGGDGSCAFVCKQVDAVRLASDLIGRRLIDISGGGKPDCMCPLSPAACTCPGRSANCPATNWTGRYCGCGCPGIAGWDAHQYPLPNAPLANASMISCADEYGATPGTLAGHEWVSSLKPHLYHSKDWVGNFTEYSNLLQGMTEHRGLSSAIYTQISDIEAEMNGIQSYDRVLKLSPADADQVRSLNLRLWWPRKSDDDESILQYGPLLASIFTNNTVLQRAPATPLVWGWATASSKVLVHVSGIVPLSTTAAANGSWSVAIPASSARTNVSLEVTCGTQTVTRGNIAFGEVIFFGGQSNMDFSVNRSFFHQDVVEQSDDPLLRVATVQTTVSVSPQEDLVLNAWPTRQWQQVTPETVVNVSAVAYFAGRQLRRQLGESVPIGLLCSYLSGTPIEPWLPPSAVAKLHLNCTDKQPCSPLWNGMIYPLRRYSITAHTWWQGEGNVANMAGYRLPFEALISSWRSEWAAPAENKTVLPFFFFLLEPYSLAWYNILRQQQIEAAAVLPSVYGVNVLDVGDRGSPYGTVHIRNKEVAGFRLSLQLLQVIYGYDNIACGPVMVTASIVSATNGSQTVAVTFVDQAWPMPMRVLPTEQCKHCCTPGGNPFSAGATAVAAQMKPAVHASVDSDSPKAGMLHVSFGLAEAKDLVWIGLHFT